MERIKYRISLDMFEVATQTTIKAKKGDTACSVYITLTDHGKVYNITEGCYAVFSGKKSDGNYIFNSETCRIEGNTIVYDFTSQTVAREGIVECEVILYKGEDRLTSPRFNLMVDATLYNDEEIMSSPEADAFGELLERTEELISDVESKLENGEFTPEKGVDYFTEEEQESFAAAIAEDVNNNLPIATNETVGVVKGTPNGDYGIMISANGDVQVRRATSDDINARKHTSRPIVPANLKQAVTSVFEDVYSEVYVQTGKLETHVKNVIASVMNSMVKSFWDGDVWAYDDGTDVSVSVDNLENVKGEFVGQIIYIRAIDRTVFDVYMYLGLDVMQLNVWTKLGELPD